jgi:cob(I)alamin adenosyltransferase
MKIYTRTGDDGETSLFGGGRVPKDHLRVEAYGTVDELNAALGLAILSVEVTATRDRIGLLQHDLFAIGAHLATPPPAEGRRAPELPPLPLARIAEMEAWIDQAETELPPLRAFILPGGSRGAAELHLCRTICRRAERGLLPLLRSAGENGPQEEGPAFALRFLNRLSDLLFVLARFENLRSRVLEVEWVKERG